MKEQQTALAPSRGSRPLKTMGFPEIGSFDIKGSSGDGFDEAEGRLRRCHGAQLQAGSCKQLFMFVHAPFLTTSLREHDHVHYGIEAGFADRAEQQGYNDHPSVRQKRSGAIAQDLHARLVVPVMQYEFQ